MDSKMNPLCSDIEDYKLSIFQLLEQVSKHNRVIRALEIGIADKDEQLKMASEKLMMANEQLKVANEQLKVANEQLKVANEQLKVANEQSVALSLKISQLQRKLEDRDREIDEMQQSIAWHMTMRFHNSFVMRALPQGTKRREFYDNCLKRGRSLTTKKLSCIRKNFGISSNKSRNKIRPQRPTIQLPRPIVQPSRPVINKKISIIIPTKNAGSDLDYSLEKIRNQKGIGEVEIIIVDSGSTDRTVDIANKNGAIIFKIKPEEFNHGATRNYGSKKATGDYILFMVQDSIPIGDYWLHDLAYALEKDKRIAAVTCKQIPRTDADIFACFSLYNHYKALDLNCNRVTSITDNFDELSYMEKRKLIVVDNVCCMFRKIYFDKFNFKDLKFAEDLEIGIRLLNDGYNLAFLNFVGVIHSHNRNPAYFFKRSYADTKILEDLLDYSPQSPLPNKNYKLNRILGNIAALYAILNKSLQDDTFVLGDSSKDSLLILKNLLRSNSRDSILKLNSYRKGDKYIDSLLEKIQNNTEDIELWWDGFLLDDYLDMINELEAYMAIYPPTKEYKNNLISALYKSLAILCGSTLAIYFNCSSNKSKNVYIEIIDRILGEEI